jgi:hypothetical protein
VDVEQIVASTNYPVGPTAYSGRSAGEKPPTDQEMCYFELRAAIGPGRSLTMIEGEGCLFLCISGTCRELSITVWQISAHYAVP